MQRFHEFFARKTLTKHLLLLTTFIAFPQHLRAETIFESATGSAGSSGTSIEDDGWFFHNFEVTEPTQINEVGGYFRTFDSAQLFGAVVALSSELDFPNSIDLTSADLLGTTVFNLPDTGFDGGEFSGVLPLSLNPGWYAVGFGTGSFGAASSPQFGVGMPSMATDLAPNIHPYSQFQADHPAAPNQRVFQVSSPRFFVKSAGLPAVSADFNNSGFVDENDLQQWQNSYGTNSLADAEGDGDSDGIDFLTWQQQFTPAPEPNTVLANGDFETGSLAPWTTVVTPNGSVTAGYPNVELFDVNGDGNSSNAMRIRVGQVSFNFLNPSGGGIEQTFTVDTAGAYSLSADIAVANFDTGTNSAPGLFELLLDGSVIDSVNYNGTGGIDPGEVFRNSLSGTIAELDAGEHSLAIQIVRPLLNSREIYQFVDNVTLEALNSLTATQVVPEPCSAGILCVGIAATTLCRQRNAGKETKDRLHQT